MGTTRTERAEDPGGCGGEDRGLWGRGGRHSPLSRASRCGDSGLGRGDRSGSDRDGGSGGRRDKKGAYGQRLRLGCPARSLPCVDGARVRASVNRRVAYVSRHDGKAVESLGELSSIKNCQPIDGVSNPTVPFMRILRYPLAVGESGGRCDRGADGQPTSEFQHHREVVGASPRAAFSYRKALLEVRGQTTRLLLP